MNLRCGFKRITLILSISAAVICGFFAGNIPIEKYCTAQSHWGVGDAFVIKRPSEQELREFEDWQKAKGITIDPNAYVFADIESLPSLRDVRELLLTGQKESFWRNLSMAKLVLIVVLAGLVGATTGYLGIWLVIWFGGLGVYKLIRWIVLGFRNDMG